MNIQMRRTWIAPVLLLGTMAYALAEELTLTTYYPSPRGVYNELRTTGKVSVGSLQPQDPAARLEVVENVNTLTGIAIINSSTLSNAGSALFFRTTPTGGTNGLISTCTAGDCNGPNSLNAMVLRETGPIILESQPANAAASLQFRAGTPGALGGTSPERMRIDRDGNVGIGTITPNAKLEVIGDTATDRTNLLRLKNSNAVSDPADQPGTAVYFDTPARHDWALGASHTADEFLLRDNTLGANQLIVDGSGNVGMSAVNPSYRLNVDGDINTTGKLKEDGHSLLPSGMIVMVKQGPCPPGWTEVVGLQGRFPLGSNNPGTEYGSPTADGALPGAGSASGVTGPPSGAAAGVQIRTGLAGQAVVASTAHTHNFGASVSVTTQVPARTVRFCEKD